jgi:predicted nucleic acid-binding protein
MDFVIDASITAAWVMADEQSDLADRVIDSLDEKIATAPHLWALEMASILTVSERRKRITPAQKKMMAKAVEQLGVVEQPHTQAAVFGTIMDLAITHQLSAYDAAYLELAMRLDLPLATLDAALRKAAKTEGVILM